MIDFLAKLEPVYIRGKLTLMFCFQRQTTVCLWKLFGRECVAGSNKGRNIYSLSSFKILTHIIETQHLEALIMIKDLCDFNFTLTLL